MNKEVQDDPMPVFVLKAKDQFAFAVVVIYRETCKANGLHEQAAEVDKALAEMKAWRDRNRELVKLPYHKHVPVAGSSSGTKLSETVNAPGRELTDQERSE